MNNNEKQKNLDITPKKDIVFKRIFGTKGNEGILKDFLESILDIKIDSLTLDLNTELLPENYEGKKTCVDVRTRLADGTEVNIEMQMNPLNYSDKRCLQHWSKVYSNTISKGEKYTNLRKTICVWIIDGKIYDEFEDIESKWQIMNEKYGITNHFKELEIYIIELQKLKKSVRIKSSKKEFWLWFIEHTNEEMIKMACVSNERIKEAREQLDRIRADAELMERIRLEEAYEMDVATREARIMEEATAKGLKAGMEKGMEKGIEKAKNETAKKMLEMGLEIEVIEKTTGLTKEEINKLKEEN